MISVVIPLYNKAESIARTLATVAAQTYSDYEVVVVDDGSTDGSADIVRRINDPRLRIICQPNGGVSAARNRGIDEARGEFIAFLDADDEWKPDYLETQMALTEKYPDCDVFATRYETRSSDGTTVQAIIRKLPFQGSDGILSNYFLVASCSQPPLFTSAVMVRKTAIQAVGCFPVGIKSGEDLLTWARLSARGSIAYSTIPKVSFAIEGYEVTSKPKRIPAKTDAVGKELLELSRTRRIPHIKRYISHWHKMRSSVYMRLSMRRESFKEALTGLYYNPLNYKLYIYILLNLLPTRGWIKNEKA